MATSTQRAALERQLGGSGGGGGDGGPSRGVSRRGSPAGLTGPERLLTHQRSFSEVPTGSITMWGEMPSTWFLYQPLGARRSPRPLPSPPRTRRGGRPPPFPSLPPPPLPPVPPPSLLPAPPAFLLSGCESLVVGSRPRPLLDGDAAGAREGRQ